MGGLDRWVRDNNTLYITVMRAYGHENFKPKTFENDVAVLFLTQSVPENHPTAQPIVLSTQNAVAGQTCQVRDLTHCRKIYLNFIKDFRVGNNSIL